MNDTDIAWFAGFFEGEGCVRLGSQWNRNGRRYGAPAIYICQVNKEPLDKCQALFPFAHLYGPYKYGTNKQYHYNLAILGKGPVESVYTLIKPYLSKKRQDGFEKAFREHAEMMVERAKLPDGRTHRQKSTKGTNNAK